MSDTEVILVALEAWALESTLQRLNGMFALAIWDNKEQALVLARDRVGEKPLYWGIVGNSLVFASELSAIFHVPGCQKEINLDMLAAYFRYGYVPSPFSIIKDVYKLPAGCFVKISLRQLRSNPSIKALSSGSDSDISPAPYWSLEQQISSTEMLPEVDSDSIITTLDDKLTTAVRKQLISDVPVGAFLSGGIDSSLVVATAQKVSENPLKTFTIAFSDTAHDESNFAQSVAEHLGTDHHTLPVSAETLLDTVSQLSNIQDEPFGNPSQIPVFLLSKFAREQVTVCLSGDGGDELHAGYNRYVTGAKVWRARNRFPRFVANSTSAVMSRLPFGAMNSIGDKLRTTWPEQRVLPPAIGLKLQKLAAALGKSNVDDYYLYLRSFCDTPLKLVPGAALDYNIFSDIAPLSSDSDFIEHAMYLDTLTYLPDDSLAKVDRAAMASALETRLPMLDKDFLSYSWQIPISLKTRNNATKWCLRELLSAHLPNSLIDRPKMGFTVPISDWLKGPLREWGNDTLFGSLIRQSDAVSQDELRVLWTDHQSGKSDNGLVLWAALSFAEWLQQLKAS
jgi:asparagine synthase (glutamine-hydrolysing)